MTIKQSSKYIDKWQKENIDRIVIKPNKRDHVVDRIQMALDKGLAKSRQSYILNAVFKQLEADGIPEVEEE